MALDLIPYHKKRVLIIEDLAEMRSSLKSMLAAMGVQQMETVNNGEEGLLKLNYNTYDIVFSDYELGKGKDGQQVLEEARHAGKMPASTAYIMVTAAQTVEMVMGALENEPDGYIAKPVTLDILRTRLNRIIRTKDVYREINQCIDRRDTNGALEACNRLAVEQPRFALPAYRIKGKLLLAEQRYDEAWDIYETVLGIKRVAWAVLGMAKVEFLRGDPEKARESLEGLVNARAQYVEAQDWLAQVLEAQGNLKAAQQILMKAVEQSPKSVRRQIELSRLAELNSDEEVLFKSSKKANALSKHSLFHDADNQIRYAKALQRVIRQGSSRDQKMASRDAMNALEGVKLDFELTPLQMMKCGLMEARTLFNSGHEDVARIAYSASMAMLSGQLELNLDDRLDVLSAQLIFEDENTGHALSDALLKEIGSDHRLQTRYYAVLDHHLATRPEQRLTLLRQRGQELLKNKDYESAWDALGKACRLPNADIDCQVNALEAVVGWSLDGGGSPQATQQAEELFARLQEMDSNAPQFATMEKLRLQWKQLHSPEPNDDEDTLSKPDESSTG